MTRISKEGVTVKVETWVRRAERHGDGGWWLELACGHKARLLTGPAVVDYECETCGREALEYLIKTKPRIKRLPRSSSHDVHWQER